MYTTFDHNTYNKLKCHPWCPSCAKENSELNERKHSACIYAFGLAGAVHCVLRGRCGRWLILDGCSACYNAARVYRGSGLL